MKFSLDNAFIFFPFLSFTLHLQKYFKLEQLLVKIFIYLWQKFIYDHFILFFFGKFLPV